MSKITEFVELNEQSLVLLKNDSILPLKTSKFKQILTDCASIVAIGPSSKALSSPIINCAEGYKLDGKPDSELLTQAMTLAKSSEAIIFLIDTYGTHDELPENTVQTFKQLKELKKPIIGVVCNKIDFSAFMDCGALIYFPSKHFSQQAQTIVDVICGTVNPWGRLSFSTQQFGFGHGHSYSRFSYSHLSVSDSAISFSVKNISSIAGTEVAQVYVNNGKEDGEKTLVGFEKLALAPRKTKRISFNISSNQDYVVYIGGSINDVCLKRAVSGSDSGANIVDGNFTLSGAGGAQNETILTEHFELEQLFSGELDRFKQIEKEPVNVPQVTLDQLVERVSQSVHQSEVVELVCTIVATGSLPNDNPFSDELNEYTASLHGLKRLANSCENNYPIDESAWTRIDQFEAQFGQLDNKTWRNLERFISTFLALNGSDSIDQAIDCAIQTLLNR